jgi:hypothetical protein
MRKKKSHICQTLIQSRPQRERLAVLGQFHMPEFPTRLQAKDRGFRRISPQKSASNARDPNQSAETFALTT